MIPSLPGPSLPKVRLVFLAVVAGACLTCAATYPIAKVPEDPRSSGPRAAWDYEVAVRSDAAELEVTAVFAPVASIEFSVSQSAEPFVRDLRVERRVGRRDEWDAVERRGTSWFVPACRSGCRIRYRFALRYAAESIRRDAIATQLGDGIFEAPPHAWLVHPLQAQKADRLRFRVTTPDGVQFATGLTGRTGLPGLTGSTGPTSRPSSPRADSDTYEIPAVEIGRVPYSLFGRWRASLVRVNDATLKLIVLPGALQASDADLTRWISQTATVVHDYYGTFPLDGALYAIIPEAGHSVGFGRATAGAGGGAILIDVGNKAGEKAFARDWVALHETIHLTFPSVARKHLWVEEGLATYLEPILRRRAGLLDERAVWQQFYEMMPEGLPNANDRGLDGTPSWGRLYWGGAIFWFVADLEIRKQTQNTRSLRDALRAILHGGGNNAEQWDLERAWEEGDHATGTHVLRELGASMGSRAVQVDLQRLFHELGVHAHGQRITLDDAAPLAKLRRSITLSE